VPFPTALNLLASAHVLHELGEHAAAAERLARARVIGEGMRSRLLACMSGLIEAHAAQAAGDEARARTVLRDALALARACGYAAFAWWRPAVMARLAVLALEAGIEVDHVQDLVRRQGLAPEPPPIEVDRWPWPLRVYTLGDFRVERDGAPLEFRAKAPKMPMALLKALVALGGRGVPETTLAEALWPDAEGDLAHQALATTLHRLRQAVGLEGAVVLRDGRLSLDPRHCWVDAWAFEALGDRADEAGRRGPPARAVALLERSLAYYRGAFLAGETGAAWTLSARERLRRRFLRQVGHVGRYREAAGEWARAIEWYERGLEVDDLAEEFYQRLMASYRGLGRRAEALAVYERCRATLAATLGVPPSPETERLRRALTAGG
jgi:DNA-binding SARP family transcriptional activator